MACAVGCVSRAYGAIKERGELMGTDRTRTYPQPLELRWDSITLLLLVTRPDFEALVVRDGYRYDEKARRLHFVCRGPSGPFWETFARVKFGPAGVSLDLGAEQLRQHPLSVQRQVVDSLALMAGDYRITVPRLDWAMQFAAVGVDLRGLQEYSFRGDRATRESLLEPCASVGLFEPGIVHKSNVPGRITSVSGTTDYRLYRKTRRSGKAVEKDEVVLRIYDAHGMAMAFLRAECQERLARRAFTGAADLSMHKVTWSYFVSLPSGVPCGLDGETQRSEPSGRDNMARSISSAYNSMFRGVEPVPVDGNVDAAFALATFARMLGYELSRWPLLVHYARPPAATLHRWSPALFRQQQLVLTGTKE
ncbi:MAG TPA: hypothetical protein DCQ04_10485 [Actinobacteria bacterium]|nr:hypothetical protein [Actinomycetota bacterium]